MRCARLLLWQVCHGRGLFIFITPALIGNKKTYMQLIFHCHTCWEVIRKAKAGKAEKEKNMNQGQKVKEINEAIMAGKRALNSLGQANKELGSASNWGLWDMLGGGLFSTIMKHSRMDDAEHNMEEARYHLRLFQKELQDIDVPAEFRMEISGFLCFADFFFDGLIADWMVQSKIEKAKEQVVEAIEKVGNIVQELKQWEKQLCIEEREKE